MGVNVFRALLAASRSLWFIQQVEQQDNQPIDLLKNRPWYRRKKHSTQLDIHWMFKEMLSTERIIPTPAFTDQVPLFHLKNDSEKHRAA